MKMKIATKYYEKDFRGEDSKNTYLKVCKWIAKYVISDPHTSVTSWKITKTHDDLDGCIFKLELYTMLDLQEMDERFCKVCREVHKVFFENCEICNVCRKQAYARRMQDALSISKDYLAQRIT